ncbi:MAG TPA: lipopolysaccharide biosynthesis protein [Steroidobacteraceae bacterium]|jgi:O-antigen/teichoic acid export membrane protein
MSIERQTVAGLKWGAAAKLATQAVSWCVTLVVIRLLVPADYGLMAMSAVVMSIVAGIAELGLGASLVQARNLEQSDVARVFGALLAINLACMISVCLAAPLIAELFGHPRLAAVIRVSSLQFVLTTLAAVPESIAYREMRFRRLAAADVVAGLVTSGTTLALALIGAGVWSLVIGNLAGAAARSGLLLVGTSPVWPVFQIRGISQFMRFGGTWCLSRFAWQLSYQADVVIAGRFLSQEAVGFYSVAVQLANMPLQKAMSVVNQVAFPAIARLQTELPRMKRRLLDAIRLLALGAVPIMWGICAVAPEFVDVALDDDWGAVTLPLQTVALAAPLRIVSGIFSTAMSALGRADMELANNLVTLVLMPIAFVCGVQWGLPGLALSYAVAVVLSFVLNFPRSSRVLDISLRELAATCGGAVLSGLVMLGVVTLARAALPDVSVVARLVALVAIGAAAYLAMLWLLDRASLTDAKRLVTALREES